MSIQEKSQQMKAIAFDIPIGEAEGVRRQLGAIIGRLKDTDGGTSSGKKLVDLAAKLKSAATDLAAGLNKLHEDIEQAANLHRRS
ncbi:MAG TPA: hypothetical protein VGL46_12610 [Pseudonocardiaceae bacterium]|jgi:hypothetical protein